MLLSNLDIKNAKAKKKAYKMYDSEGLFINITPTGSKLWKMKYHFNNKEKALSFGPYPEVSLKEARDQKYNARKLLRNGIDPSAEKKNRKASALKAEGNSFELVAKEWHLTNLNKWSEQHAKKIWRRIELHLLPKLGSKSISKIKPMEILTVIRVLESNGSTEVTHRILQTCSSIYRYAIITERASYNPANDLSDALIPHKAENYPTIKIAELAKFMNALKTVETSVQNKIAVQLLLLTFLRTGEMRHSRWENIDFDNAQWVIPAPLTKMKRDDHIVPLSIQCIKLLKQLKEITTHCPHGYILPSQNRQKNPMMSENTVNNVIKKMGYKGKIVGHGFRALASTTLNEQGYRADVIERQLAHKEPNNIRATYNKAEYLPERTTMMQDWADLIDVQMQK